MVSNLLTKPLQNGSSKPNAILPAQSTPTTSATSYVGVPSTPGITNSPNNPQKESDSEMFHFLNLISTKDPDY